jgi:hypothetical protein
MDPVLKLDLLGKVLEMAGKGSYPLNLALERHLTHIRALTLDLNVPWINPVSESAERVRPDAARAVKGLPGLERVVGAAEREQQRIHVQVLGSDCQVAGWLAFEKEKGWHCRAPTALAAQRALYVIDTDGGKPAWKRITKVSDGKPVLDSTVDCLVEGRLVFAAGGAD